MIKNQKTIPKMKSFYKVRIPSDIINCETFIAIKKCDNFSSFLETVYNRLPELRDSSVIMYYKDRKKDKIIVQTESDFALFEEEYTNTIFILENVPTPALPFTIPPCSKIAAKTSDPISTIEPKAGKITTSENGIIAHENASVISDFETSLDPVSDVSNEFPDSHYEAYNSEEKQESSVHKPQGNHLSHSNENVANDDIVDEDRFDYENEWNLILKDIENTVHDEPQIKSISSNNDAVIASTSTALATKSDYVERESVIKVDEMNLKHDQTSPIPTDVLELTAKSLSFHDTNPFKSHDEDSSNSEWDLISIDTENDIDIISTQAVQDEPQTRSSYVDDFIRRLEAVAGKYTEKKSKNVAATPALPQTRSSSSNNEMDVDDLIRRLEAVAGKYTEKKSKNVAATPALPEAIWIDNVEVNDLDYFLVMERQCDKIEAMANVHGVTPYKVGITNTHKNDVASRQTFGNLIFQTQTFSDEKSNDVPQNDSVDIEQDGQVNETAMGWSKSMKY
ncbi:uncharacterized protein LOC116341732 isoform X1 [Contarinia nasturtii]|uniref:uncharacterized protein LOC116341732 isoform X1 n=1 Tax=Contarinia nasturtii TaxID=265458 RepID=UPI0012D3CAA2|nr:uncharacterized protein LOC116341732 isoform X1 [Contarinia nasturtii]